MTQFEQTLAASWPPEKWQERTVLLAVSGGADSVALLRAMARLKLSGDGALVVAHFNHGIRAASADDETFVARLAEQLSLRCIVGHPERPIDAASASEDQLRTARYRFLHSIAEKLGAGYVATAHTADDQTETILHRILRGTAVSGLTGIPRTRPIGTAAVLIRPMLAISRAMVLEYLQSLDQPFCEDVTNRDPSFTRNRIRHELLPLLRKEFNPQVSDALLRLGRHAADMQSIVDHAVAAFGENRLQIKSPSQIDLNCQGLSEADRPLLRELFVVAWKQQSWPLADMGFNEWERLATIAISSDPQTIELPGPVRAQRTETSLLLTRNLPR